MPSISLKEADAFYVDSVCFRQQFMDKFMDKGVY